METMTLLADITTNHALNYLHRLLARTPELGCRPFTG